METEIKNPHKCDTCGKPLAPGHKPGNHVRGKEDEACDGCSEVKPKN